ncbi:hypothetical protein ACQUJT_10085 [Ralstonia pseudosolanacearum]|uniref:Transmembrane protein n=1 Tax=Ralstonia solanacearum TaxID=305 RepID=A0AA92Q5Y6_RALSL|nr:hypothetical protein [Ralstonia pseudosolanacearum]QOK91588.1 hypothetical protein HF908_08925 [Ralstonia pseudosolanacearum]QOK96453.1 hypothetical protein HF909_08425 [Ralstonia pseudosolanacearum]UWD89714.1 hypothetical protein NY025_18670 [Ralstonia pseudosolanacearum]CAH0441686.1 hypothetical protein LMG9673_02491 [Ralstonia pseudosolanacearum]
MSTRHMRRPAGASRTTYIRSAQSGSIGGRSIGEHRLPPSGVPRLLLWLLVSAVVFALLNLAARHLGYL